VKNYNELQTFISDFLARDDLTTQIPTFISLAEQRMSRELQIALLERAARADVYAEQQFIVLPPDLRGIRDVAKIDSEGKRISLRYLTPAQLDTSKQDSGQPTDTVYYSITANDIELFAIPTAAFQLEIIYDEGVDQLSDSRLTNTMLTRHGDAYLHGALKAAFDFLQDEQRAMYHDAQFTRCLAEVERDSKKQRYGTADLQIRRSRANAY